jgi:multisubunit Na+/H+ antiporter MnhC subunit
MPTETAIIITGIVLMFALFAVALAWADYYTRNYRALGAVYFHEPVSKE